MVAFIIFGAALLCVIFFLLGTVCKGLASLFNGLISSAIDIIAIAVLVGLGEMVLFALFSIASATRTSGIGEGLGTIVLLVISVGILWAIVGGLGSIIFELIIEVLDCIINFISTVLEGAATICERAYAHFLLAIIKRIEQC